MLKLEQFINGLTEVFQTKYSEGPKLQIKRKSGKGEGFQLHYANGIVTLSAPNPLATCFGLGLLEKAVASGHLADFLGEHSPQFSLRPLWIAERSPIYSIADEIQVESLCQRILMLGYNAVLLESCFLSPEKRKIFQDYGLKLILKKGFDKPNTACVLDDSFQEKVQALFSSDSFVGEYFFWESTFSSSETTRHPKARNFLEEDLARLELSLIRKSLPSGMKLIYYISCKDAKSAAKQSTWIRSFCEDVPPDTWIGFSAVAGDVTSDHSPAHPFWNEMRTAKESSHLNLLPVVNVGSVEKGEGFWPSLPLDLINRYVLRCDPKTFAGVVVLASHVPANHALASCPLWVASQMQWGIGRTPELLAETWFAAYGYAFDVTFLESIRSIVVDLSKLNNKIEQSAKEEYRILTENLFARLKYLQCQVEKISDSGSASPSFKDYFSYFYRDARRLIFHFLQRNHLPMVGVMSEDDQLESFWTAMTKIGNKTAVLLEQPNPGAEGSLLNEIYRQVSCIGQRTDPEAL